MTWLILVPVFMTFMFGAWATYTPVIRHSHMYLWVMIGSSLANAWFWVLATKRLDTTDSIVLFSLLFDALMIVAYYGYPAVIGGHQFTWQAWVSGALVIAGLFWFKLATE